MTIHRIGLSALLAGLVLAAGPSDASAAACVDALYQLEVLRLGTRVIKPGLGDERTDLHDRDRPAEVERQRQYVAGNCPDLARDDVWIADRVLTRIRP